MTAPARHTHVRVSIRPLSEGQDDGWGTQSWTHSTYHTLDALHPLSGAELVQSGARFDAEWMAVSTPYPVIKDGWQLVTLADDGTDAMVFDVKKVLPVGRRVRILLAEHGAAQPVDQ